MEDPTDLPALDGWTLTASDRLGEFSLRALIELATGQPRLDAEAAAAWGGDRIAAYHRSDGARVLLLWQIVYDNPAEHHQGLAGLREWLIAHAGGFANVSGNAELMRWQGASATIRLIDSGDALWLIATDSDEFGAQIAAKLQAS